MGCNSLTSRNSFAFGSFQVLNEKYDMGMHKGSLHKLCTCCVINYWIISIMILSHTLINRRSLALNKLSNIYDKGFVVTLILILHSVFLVRWVEARFCLSILIPTPWDLEVLCLTYLEEYTGVGIYSVSCVSFTYIAPSQLLGAGEHQRLFLALLIGWKLWLLFMHWAMLVSRGRSTDK